MVRVRGKVHGIVLAIGVPILAIAIGAVYLALFRIETRTLVCDHHGADGDACHLIATGPVSSGDERIATSDIGTVWSASHASGTTRSPTGYYTLAALIRGQPRVLQDDSSSDVTESATAELTTFVADASAPRTTIVLHTPDWLLSLFISLVSIPFFVMAFYVIGIALAPAVIGRLVPQDEA